MASRLAVLLMVIAVGGCDNVEWGGIDLAIVPPPERERDTTTVETTSALPEGPVLFYVHRDSAGATVIPVGQIAGDALAPITPGEDMDDFGARFMDAFLAPDAQLALFRRGQRVGTLSIDSAVVPEPPVCRPLPRATGTVELAGGTGDVTEFLALQPVTAPESRPDDELEPVRSMQVVSDMLAGDMLRARNAGVINAAAARMQLQPFPLTGSPDPGFTVTYLVDDTLGLGDDDTGASLFVVFTPRGQAGYEPAFVSFTGYDADGKAAPRVIDFLDWDRDGAVEILLEIFGTGTSWFRAVGVTDDGWGEIFEERCDPRTAPAAVDTIQPAGSDRPGRTTPAVPTGVRRPQAGTMPDLDAIPEPTIQLSSPAASPTAGRDTAPPDTGGGGR